MKMAAWLLYLIAATCIAAGLLLLSPPIALAALGLLIGRVALLIDKDGEA
jgi:hypothetical protein